MTATSMNINVGTGQSFLSHCAQAQSQWVVQRIQLAPMQAIQAHVPLNMMSVLELLQK